MPPKKTTTTPRTKKEPIMNQEPNLPTTAVAETIAPTTAPWLPTPGGEPAFPQPTMAMPPMASLPPQVPTPMAPPSMPTPAPWSTAAIGAVPMMAPPPMPTPAAPAIAPGEFILGAPTTAAPATPPMMRDHWIKQNQPSHLALVSLKGKTVSLHYLNEGTVRNVRCLETPDCPACLAEIRPRENALLPVINVLGRSIEVLKLPMGGAPGDLLTQLQDVVRDPAIMAKYLKITREGTYYYNVTLTVPPEPPTWIPLMREQFLAGYDPEVLAESYTLSAAKMRALKPIRESLEALGLLQAGSDTGFSFE